MARGGMRWTPEQLENHLHKGAPAPHKTPPRATWPTPESEFKCAHCEDPEPHVHRGTVVMSPEEYKDAQTASGQLAQQLAQAGVMYAREVEFHPHRGWRFDFVFPMAASRLALEINGGLFVQGRHIQGARLLDEYEKLSEAAILGYRVLLTTPNAVKSGHALNLVLRALVSGETSTTGG